MKKIIILSVISVFLAACSPKDEDYYFNNLEKAKEKYESCEKEFMQAVFTGDEKKGRSVEADVECKAAKSAINKQHDIELEKARVERELQKKKEEAEKQKAISDAKESLAKELSGKNWQGIITEFLKQENCNGFGSSQDPNCIAWKEAYDTAVKDGKAELSKESFENLSMQEAVFCGLDKRWGSACDVWRDARIQRASKDLTGLDILALEEKKTLYCDQGDSHTCGEWRKFWDVKNKEIVTSFVNNDELFIEAYNGCYEMFEKIRNSNEKWAVKNQLENELKQAMPCNQAAQAFRERGMGYSNFKSPIAQ